MRNIPELAEEKDAGKFRKDTYRDDIKKISDFILQRVREIRNRGSHVHDDIPDVRREIDNFFTDWDNKARIMESESKELVYGNSRLIERGYTQDIPCRLLKPYHQKAKDEMRPWETLTSMRNIDSEVSGRVLIWKEGQK